MTEPAPAHTCHALGCGRECPPRHLMCPMHWGMVPPEIGRLIYAAYRPGQEVDKRPSAEWIKAANLAVTAVAVAEGRTSFRCLNKPCYRLECQNVGVFGFGVQLHAGALGLWYCPDHRGDGQAIVLPLPAGRGPDPRQGRLL